MEKKSILGLTNKKEENFSEWYTELITKSELIEYSEISGCYVLRPYSYKMWELIQRHLDEKFNQEEIVNAYFPMFVSEKTLSKEQEHLEGFTPEVAWVTHSGDTKLDKKLAIRPTSETIIYPYFSKWIRTHRDLPIKINQWCNIVRWEFKDPTPFIRSREFLWQEAHTAHETSEEASNFVNTALDIYYDTYKELLGIPTIKGIKTNVEKFAGADYTTTVEGYIKETGKGIQGATSHNLGQNFSKMFDIEYIGADKNKYNPYQTSFGFTTRSIGLMIMTHSDNKGLVLPPSIAPIQIVIIPIFSKKYDSNIITSYSKKIYNLLKNKYRVKFDDDTTNTAGFKYNYWELKGVPLRIEIGGKEVDTNSPCLFCRDTFEKSTIQYLSDDVMMFQIDTELNKIHNRLYNKAKTNLDTSIVECLTFDDFIVNIKQGKMILTPFCDNSEIEEKVKNICKDTYNINGIKTLCKPYEIHKEIKLDDIKCFYSNLDAKTWVLWGKSY